MAILIPEEQELLFSIVAEGYGKPTAERPLVEFYSSEEIVEIAGFPADGLFNEQARWIILNHDVPLDYMGGCFVHEATHWMQAAAVDWKLWNVVHTEEDILRMEFEAFKNQRDFLRAIHAQVPPNRDDMARWSDYDMARFIVQNYAGAPMTKRILEGYAEKRRMGE